MLQKNRIIKKSFFSPGFQNSIRRTFLLLLVAFVVLCFFSEKQALADSFSGIQGFYLDDEFIPFGDVTVYRQLSRGQYLVYHLGQYLHYDNNSLSANMIQIVPGLYNEKEFHFFKYYDGEQIQELMIPHLIYRYDEQLFYQALSGWKYGTSIDDINNSFSLSTTDNDRYMWGSDRPFFPTVEISDQKPLYAAYVRHRFYSVTFILPENISDTTEITYVTVNGGKVTPPQLPATHAWESEAYLNVNQKLTIRAISLCETHQIEVDEAIQPTCIETGLTEGTHCIVCHDTLIKQEIVPATGHTIVIDQAVDPDVINTGLTEGSHCSVCGKIIVPQRTVLYSGNCGPNARWTVDDSFLLTVSGIGTVNGSSPDYSFPADIKSRITDIVIEEGINALQENAFSWFSTVRTVSIPASCTSVLSSTGETLSNDNIRRVFTDCSSLSAVNISTGNLNFFSDNGILYDKQEASLVFCPPAFSDTVIIPDDIMSISAGAFSNCPNVTKVVLHYDVSFIPDDIFSNCDQNLILSVPDGSYSHEYAEKAGIPFEITSLYTYIIENEEAAITKYTGTATVIHIPQYIRGKPVTKIGAEAFIYQDQINTVIIPDGIKEIGNNCFYGCINMNNITLPETLATIGTNALPNSTQQFYASIDSPLAKALSRADYSFRIPGTYFDLKYPFNYHINDISSTELTMCHIDSNVSVVEIPDYVTSLESNLFSENSSVEIISFPSTITRIYSLTFNKCKSLSTITIPSSITKIDSNAFYECTNLEHVAILNYDCTINPRAFNRCNLHDIAFRGRRLQSDSAIIEFGSCGQDTFWYNNEEKILTIGGVGRVDSYTYSDDRYGYYTNQPWNQRINTVIVQEGITELGTNTFARLGNLKVYLPQSIQSILEDAFLKDVAEIYFTPTKANKHIIGNYGGTLTWYFPSGICGNDAKWILVDENTIRIAGSGAVEDATWDIYENNIDTIIISSEISSINDNVLQTLSRLQSIIFDGDIPFMAPSAFADVTATAYYSHKNSIWPDDQMHDYGGNITWRPYCTHLDSAITPFEAIHYDEVQPTDCITNGHLAHWKCSSCGLAFGDDSLTRQLNNEDWMIPPRDHEWSTDVTYVWADDYSTVTASRSCIHDATHIDSETVSTTKIVTVSPSDTDPGTFDYVSDTFINNAFTVQRTEGGTIPALGTLDILYLPAGLITIEDEAFAGLNCQAIIIPNGCAIIGHNAFADCTNLVYVFIPDCVTTMETDAFTDCPNVIIDRAGELSN